MKVRAALNAGIAATLVAFGHLAMADHAKADTVQLANGDILRGKVVSLNEKQLIFHSDNFGDIKIERSKVDLIALGTTPLPSVKPATASSPSTKSTTPPAASKSGIGSLLSGASPLLGTTGGAQSLGPGIDQLLGAGGVGDLQKNVDNAKRGLQDLKKDLGNGPEGQAIDAYINLLNQFGAIGALAGQPAHPSPPPAPAQRPKPAESVKKPNADANKPAK